MRHVLFVVVDFSTYCSGRIAYVLGVAEMATRRMNLEGWREFSYACPNPSLLENALGREIIKSFILPVVLSSPIGCFGFLV